MAALAIDTGLRGALFKWPSDDFPGHGIARPRAATHERGRYEARKPSSALNPLNAAAVVPCSPAGAGGGVQSEGCLAETHAVVRLLNSKTTPR